MSDQFKFVQAQSFTLAGSGAVIGDTSIVLSSFKQIDGTTNLTMTDFGSIGFMTIEPNSGTQEEQISFTGVTQNANGTATLTGVKTVLFISPYTETSGLAKTHAGGTKAIISNTAGFYDRLTGKDDDETINGLWTFVQPPISATNPTTSTQIANKAYVDGIAIAGAPDASTTVKGITKLATAPASPTSPIAVGDNDGRVPTQGENDALVGSSGTPSSSNKYITADDVSDAAVSGKVVRATGTALPALDGVNLTNVVHTQYAPVWKNGTVAAATTGGSTTQNIAHGLSATPKFIRLTIMMGGDGTGITQGVAVTTYNGTNQASIYSFCRINTSPNSTVFGVQNAVLVGASDKLFSATITTDATNIIISWVLTVGAGLDVTPQIMWEAMS